MNNDETQFDLEMERVLIELKLPISEKKIFIPFSRLKNSLENEYIDERIEWSANRRRQEEDIVDSFLNLAGTQNKGRFDALVEAIQQNRVVPFVGAGATTSEPLNFKGWGGFLSWCAEQAGENSDELWEKYKDDYENFAQFVIDKLGADWFNSTIRNEYGKTVSKTFMPYSGILSHLLAVEYMCVVTTNFDRAIEQIFSNKSIPFEEKFSGIDCEDFIDSYNRKKRCLLKLHGDAKSTVSRILTKKEYNNAYGSQSVDLRKHLPIAINHLYGQCCFLFLGCSLSVDRTLKVFKKSKELVHNANHFAFLAYDSSNIDYLNFIRKKDKELMGYGIHTVWYPNTKSPQDPADKDDDLYYEHEALDIFLKELEFQTKRQP